MTLSESRKTLGRPLLLVLVAVSAVGPMTLNGVLPATTAIMAELSAPYQTAQLVLTVYLFATLVSQLILGPAADRYGRRPILMFGLCVFTVGGIACALSTTIEWLLVGRFIQGIGGAVCVILPRTIVRDVYPRDRAASVIGYMTTAMMVAPMFAPAAGGWMTDTVSWRLLYAALATFGVVLIVLAYRFQPETASSRTSVMADTDIGNRVYQGSFFRASWVLLKIPGFNACALMQAGVVGVYYSFLAGAPYVAMESRGLSASTYGAWFSMVAVGYLSGNFAAGWFTEARGAFGMLVIGTVPAVLGMLLFWILSGVAHPVSLFLPMLMVAFSNGMTLPSMFSISMSVRPDLAATASGLAGSLQTAVGVLLTVLVGYVLPFSDAWLFVIITVSTGVGLLGLLWTLSVVRH